MKVGDEYESSTGGRFKITSVNKQSITVEVERLVRKGGKHEPQKREKRIRVIQRGQWDSFAGPYEAKS